MGLNFSDGMISLVSRWSILFDLLALILKINLVWGNKNANLVHKIRR